MKFFTRIFLTLSLVFTSPYGFADELKSNQCETAINCTVTQGNTTTTTTTPQSTDGGSTLRRNSSGNTVVTTTTNYGSAGTAGTGAYSQAQDAKNQANTTMIAAFAMAAMLAAMCNPPHNITPCILAPLAALAGMMAGQKKNEAQKVMDNLGTSGTTDSATTTDSTTTDAENAATLAKIKDDLAKKGVKMNGDGSTTLPNGATVASDLNNSSLKAAGLSDSQISSLRKDLDKMKKDINNGSGAGGVEYQDVASNAGGYDGGRTAVDGDREIASAGVEADRTGIDKDNANKWNGFFKQYGDSQIGVAQSDIFLMVEKRVDSERKIMGQ